LRVTSVRVWDQGIERPLAGWMKVPPWLVEGVDDDAEEDKEGEGADEEGVDEEDLEATVECGWGEGEGE